MSASNSSIDITRYKIISKIGEGASSQVYRVKDSKTDNYYAAKISKSMIDDDAKDSQEARLLFREVNVMSLLNHPSVLKFVGYYSTDFEERAFPTIITEIASNGSLLDIINMESQGISPDQWNTTKKLINIYGIASGMSYLHAHNVIHRDLKPENILINNYLHPKISDFGLSKITDFLSVSMNFQSQKGLKGTPIYMAPEIFESEEYSKASDVYAFGFIVYVMFTLDVPFKNLNIFKLIKKIKEEGYRPKINDDVESAYRSLIESCWSQKPEDRPTFDQIVEDLKTNKEFITENVDEDEFLDYIDFIDESQSTFDVDNKMIHFADFINSHARNKNVKPVLFNDEFSDTNTVKKTVDSPNEIDYENNSNKEDEKEEEEELLIPKTFQLILDELSEESKSLVENAEKDPTKQFEVGQFLIEGKNGFPKNVKCGLKYIENSINQNNIDAIIYYTKLLIKGKMIKQDFTKAMNLISKLNERNDNHEYFLQGLLSRKRQRYSEAAEYFENGSDLGDLDCMYEYARILFIGEGIKKNSKMAIDLLKQSKQKGHKKSDFFLKALETLNKIKTFSAQSPETQLILILANVKNLQKNQIENDILKNIEVDDDDIQFNQIFLKYTKTEKLYYNKSLISPSFHECLKHYKKAIIEIQYPLDPFGYVVDLVLKIKNKLNCPVEIGIVFTSFSQRISNRCFSKYYTYHRVTQSVHIIPSDVFKNCQTLKKIELPSSLTQIEKNAFFGCTILPKITIPSSVIRIGGGVFNKCTNLKEIKFESNEDEIFDFYDNKYLCCKSSSISETFNMLISVISNNPKLTLPSFIKQIEEYAFNGCSSLKELVIPSSVSKIGPYAFSECTSLMRIKISSPITQIEPYTFFKCISLKRIVIPSTVTIIKSYAFYKCISLKEIEIPSSVTRIEPFAFVECSSLKEIEIPSSITKIEKNLFYKCSSLTEIEIPSSVTQFEEYAFAYCSSLKEIAIPSSVTKIEKNVFMGCSSLTKIEIPSSVTHFDEYSFAECSSLKEITIPSSLTQIEKYTFFKCSSLKQIEIPSSINQIKTFAFSGCSSLTHIEIPSSVKMIEDYAFTGCSSLIEIKIPSSATKICDFVFKGCLSLKKVTIPSSITEIGYSSFCECSSLTDIKIPSSIIHIDGYAFAQCSSLKQFEIPSSVSKIGKNVFAECSSLETIKINSSLTEIPDFVFNKCSALKEIKIPSSVKIIGYSTFAECTSLKQIEIPSSVTEIEECAFSGCTSLEQIKIPSSLSGKDIGLNSDVIITKI